MIIIIIFLVGFIVGMDRDMTTNAPVELQELNIYEKKTDEQFSTTEAQSIPQDNERLLSKFAYYCETITHKFYEMIIFVLYNFSKLFI